MNKSSNQVKSEVLGEAWGTANSKLRKSLLFYMAGLLELLDCYRCGNLIESIDVFSIEHKQSWMNSSDPVKYFYNIDNISFSHIRCNVAAGNEGKRLYKNDSERFKARHQRLRADPQKYEEFLEYKRNWYAKNNGHLSQQAEETDSKPV